MSGIEEVLEDLRTSNIKYATDNKDILSKHISCQNPKIAILSCSDSRVIPEYIFQKKIGDIFTIRIAGNIASDPLVITSLEYAIHHLNVKLLIILGHTKCGAVIAAEESKDNKNALFEEIKKSFSYNNNHILSNIKRQHDIIIQRSNLISKAVKINKLKIICAIYNIETGLVEFLNTD